MYELINVEVDTLGLVHSGMNRERFFLFKSSDSQSVPVTKDDPNNDNLEQSSFWQKLTGVVKQAVAQEVNVNEKEITPGASTPKAPAVSVDLIAKVGQLADQNAALLARLTKAEADAKAAQEAATQERDLRERQTFIAKASAYRSLPVPGGQLGDFLHWLSKSDQKRYEWFTSVLKSLDSAFSSTGMFSEVGWRGEPESLETDVIAKAATAADPKAALLGVSSVAAAQYLTQRRKALREA